MPLYIAGMTPAATKALKNLRVIAENPLEGRFYIEVVDLLSEPQLAEGEQISAVPTLVRKLLPPLRKIIGDLSNTEKVLVSIDLKSG